MNCKSRLLLIIGAVALSLCSSYFVAFCNAADLPFLENPLAYWSFDKPTDGYEFPDRYVPGQVDKAVNLSDKYKISVPSSTIPENLKELTIIAWVKPTDTSGLREILRKEDGNNRILFSLQGDGRRLAFGLGFDGAYIHTTTEMDLDVLKDGGWHCLIATFDGKRMSQYLDAQPLMSRPVSGTWTYGGPAPVYVGSLSGWGEFFNGQMDDVWLLDRALTMPQIRQYFLSRGGKIDVEKLRQKAQLTADALLEYCPRTEAQWSRCSESDRKLWSDRKALAERFEAKIGDSNLDIEELYNLIEEIQSQIVVRPTHAENVAGFHLPKTPETRTRTADEARTVLEADWLFQAGGKPTLDRCEKELGWANDLIDRLSEPNQPGSENQSNVWSKRRETLAALKNQLADLQKPGANVSDQAVTDLYFAIRTAKREIQFANPVLDFDSVLYIDNPYPEGSEWNHENHHRVGNKAVPGGRLLIQTGLSPAGALRQLAPEPELPGSFWRPDVSYDGKRVLFCFKPCNEKAFHLYEINVDGTGLTQLTDGNFDDLDPIYLPDDENIAFMTGRAHTYVRCVVSSNSFILARMKKGADELYLLSRNMETEYTPSLLPDGRIVYTRWEYTDKPLWRCQSLWTMNPDGTQVQTLWGNQSVWPDVLKDARAIPGSDRIMFTGCGHHAWFEGCIGILNTAKGFNFPDGLTKVTADVTWPECGNGPVDPVESAAYHSSGNYNAYNTPYPLSEKDFLVSARRNGKFVLLFMDTDGNRELVNEGEFNIFHAIPLKARPKPQVRIDQVEWPTLAERRNPKPGIIYSNNVYDNMPKEVQGKAKFLRIWSLETKTYTMWDHRPYASMGPATSMVQSDGVKRILGTVPIEDDGSVSFEAPAGIALHFQLLDDQHRALQTMRSFTGVMPGETRGCLGCHESQILSPDRKMTGKAMRRAPSKITPVAWSDISVSYDRYVQPILDKYCGKCHEDPNSDAYKAINFTNRKGDVAFFTEPYITLIGRPTWGKAYKLPEKPVPGFGWADTIMVEGFDQRDPNAYKTPAPMTKLSYRSRLVERMASGTHHDVKVEGDDLLRVKLWVDAMCPFYGSEELRAMGDPNFPGIDWLPVRPVIESAPIIPRPGPLSALHPEKDDAYSCPTMEKVNALPAGIER